MWTALILRAVEHEISIIHINNFLRVFVSVAIYIMYIYISRHAIGKYIEKINKS